MKALDDAPISANSPDRVRLPHRRVQWLQLALAIAFTATTASGQPNCPPLTFQTAASASLKPSSSTHVVLERQDNNSYTAFELTDASPYRIVRTTPNFQQQLTGCPGMPVSGQYPTDQQPEVYTHLSSGGYLWVRKIGTSNAEDNFGALGVVVFDATFHLVAEARYPVQFIAAIAVADVNADGLPDILCVTEVATRRADLQVLVGTGSTGFQAPVAYPISMLFGIGSIAVGDLNGDGKLDVAITSTSVGQESGQISIFNGKGDGTFVEGQALFQGNVAQQVTIADMNRDGKADLVFTATYSSAGFSPSVLVALGTGNGTFASPARFFTARSDALAVGDVDGDGFPDIVTSGITVLFGDGHGGFPRRSDYWQDTSGNVTLADFDGDGKIDVVVGNGNGQLIFGPAIEVFFNRTSGTLSGAPVSLLSDPAQTDNDIVYGVIPADFNHDGVPDLVVRALSRFVIALGKGDGTFAPGFSYTPSPGFPAALAVADFNNDGRPDLIAAISAAGDDVPPGNRLGIFLGQGDGTFQSPTFIPSPPNAVALAAADLNRDGKMDIVLVTYSDSHVNEVWIYLGDGEGGFSASGSYPAGPDANDVAVGDFNGDGHPDLVVAAQGSYLTDGSFTFLFGKGDGTFPNSVTLPATTGPQLGPVTLAVADLNRDGKLDVAGAMLDGTVQILLGRGDGTFPAPLIIPLAKPLAGQSDIEIADLNHDSIPDLIVASNYLAGNGDGTFQPAIVLTQDGPLAIADLNGDGRLDLAGAVSGVAAFLNIGQATPPLTVVPATGVPLGPLAADSLATAYGDNLAAGNIGASISVVDSTGTARPASLLYVSPHQINFVVPAGTSDGTATITVTAEILFVKHVYSAKVQIQQVAPSLFTSNADGLAAAYITRVRQGQPQTFESVSHPIDLGPDSDQVYLILYGTGIRHAGTGAVTVDIEGLNAPVTYAGPQTRFAGLDQINVLLPRALAAAGNVNLVLTAAGKPANTVHISFK